MKMIHLAAAVALTLPLLAQAAEGNLLGAGGMTCAKNTNMKTVFDKPAITLVTSWTQGYLTSINIIRMNSHQDSLRYADVEQIEAYTKKFCTEHPLKQIYESTGALAAELGAGH